MVFTTNQPLVEGDTIKVYYGGCDGTHAGPIDSWTASIGLATLRKDGFASLDSGMAVAKVMTKRLKNAAGPLHVNYDGSQTQIGGYLEVEVLDADVRVIKGYSKKDFFRFDEVSDGVYGVLYSGLKVDVNETKPAPSFLGKLWIKVKSVF